MRADTLHMTLLFLGEVPSKQCAALMQEVDALRMEPFTFVLEQLRSWNRNQIAYMAPAQEVAALVDLYGKLRAAADAVGIGYDRRAFTPHVTLVRKLEHPFEAEGVTLPEWQVDAFALVESVPGQKGALYRDLKVWSCRD